MRHYYTVFFNFLVNLYPYSGFCQIISDEKVRPRDVAKWLKVVAEDNLALIGDPGSVRITGYTYDGEDVEDS